MMERSPTSPLERGSARRKPFQPLVSVKLPQVTPRVVETRCPCWDLLRLQSHEPNNGCSCLKSLHFEVFISITWLMHKVYDMSKSRYLGGRRGGWREKFRYYNRVYITPWSSPFIVASLTPASNTFLGSEDMWRWRWLIPQDEPCNMERQIPQLHQSAIRAPLYQWG